MDVKVWLGKEGTNDAGALEALLRRVEARGWRVDGGTAWKDIRKYKAGGARHESHHADVQNVKGLVLQAYEAGCEIVAFSRDEDADRERKRAIDDGISQAKNIFPTIEIVGGIARPALEGWILALLGERDTDEMSRARASQRLADRDTSLKSSAAYVALVEEAQLDQLPPGCDSLRDWLTVAREVLPRVIHGGAAAGMPR